MEDQIFLSNLPEYSCSSRRRDPIIVTVRKQYRIKRRRYKLAHQPCSPAYSCTHQSRGSCCLQHNFVISQHHPLNTCITFLMQLNTSMLHMGDGVMKKILKPSWSIPYNPIIWNVSPKYQYIYIYITLQFTPSISPRL